MTTDAMIEGVMSVEGLSTQHCEAVNNVRAQVRPKRKHVAGSHTSEQRHGLGDLRVNLGRRGSTESILQQAGVSSIGARRAAQPRRQPTAPTASSTATRPLPMT